MTTITQRNYRAFQIVETSFHHEKMNDNLGIISGIERPIHEFINSFWAVLTAPVEQKGRI